MGKFEQPVTNPAEYLNSLESSYAVLRAKNFLANYSGPTQDLSEAQYNNILAAIDAVKTPFRAPASEVFDLLVKSGAFSLAPSEPTAQPEPTPPRQAENIISKPQLPGLKILGKIDLGGQTSQPSPQQPAPASEPEIISHRITRPFAPVQLTPEQQEVFNTNIRREQQALAYQEFYSDRHINEMVAGMPDFYQFTTDQESELVNKFRGLYSEDQIRTNCEQLRNTLNSITETNASQPKPELLEYMKKLATLAERGLAYAISDYKWFGVSKHLIPSHIYDDVLAGIDCVLQYQDRLAHSTIYTGIDITFASLTHDTYKNKIKRTLECIRTSKAPQLRYQSDAQSGPIRLLSVPKLVLHLDKKTLDTLLHVAEDSMNETPNESRKNPALGHAILRQLIEQTQAFLEYAESCESSLVEHYRATLKTLRSAAHSVKLPSPASNDLLPATRRLHEILAEYAAEHR